MEELGSVNYLSRCKDKVASFKASLPIRVDPNAISYKAKIPFKAVTYREALFYRATELAESATELYSYPDKVVSAFILTRAIYETTALLVVLHSKISAVVASKSVGDFDEYIMTNTYGWKLKVDDNLPTIPTILNAIDKADKVLGVGGLIRESYENISEYCHPNYAGVKGAYVKFDKDNDWADMGVTFTNIDAEPVIGTLLSDLEIFELYYNKISSLMNDFVDVCENEIESRRCD